MIYETNLYQLVAIGTYSFTVSFQESVLQETSY